MKYYPKARRRIPPRTVGRQFSLVPVYLLVIERSSSLLLINMSLACRGFCVTPVRDNFVGYLYKLARMKTAITMH